MRSLTMTWRFSRESVKSDESSDADLHSKLQEMFTGEDLDEILSLEN